VLGTLLGDASIGYPNKRSKNPRVYGRHSVKQQAWAEHKASVLVELGMVTKNEPNLGYGDECTTFRSQCLPCLVALDDLVRSDGRKTVSREWLDQIGDIGLAWWICDQWSNVNDGSGFHAHMEGHTEEENAIIVAWIADNFGSSRVVSYKKYFYVYVHKDAAVNIVSAAAQHVPECMQYKISGFEFNPRNRRNASLRHRSS